jgi:hypothetical protein
MPNMAKFFAHSLSGRGRSLYLTGSSVYRKAGKIHYTLKGLIHEIELKYFDKKWILLGLKRNLYWFLNF